MNTLDGRTILVTGAASGIGKATAAVAISQGARVGLLDVRADALKTAHQELGSHAAVVCDVSSADSVAASVQRLTEEIGAPDGLVNAAGIFVPDGGVTECPPDLWDRTIAVNLTSVYRVSREFLSRRTAGRSASIVNIASLYGLRGLRAEAAYDASKGGVVNLTRQMALDLADADVRVNAVAPGEILTPMTLEQLGANETVDAMTSRLSLTVPMRRMGEAIEVGRVICFLLSDQASYVTGAIVPVDGGMNAG